MEDKKKNAKILLEALPYIQKYTGKTIVVKYGGNAMVNEQLKHNVMRDMVLLQTIGVKIVLVHGGGPEISAMLDKLGKKSEFVNGLRYTDAETAEIVAMVLAGKVNKSLVSLIHKTKGRAIGVCGIDDGMLIAEKIDEGRLGFVGRVTSVNIEPLNVALEAGLMPVVASVGVDEYGQVYNINADTAAAEIAAALHAEKLISLTDVRGVLKDKDDDNSLISRIKIDDIGKLEEAGIIKGGMIPKIEACIYAMEKGAKESVIIDGRIEHSILLELFSNSGIGTLFQR
ncbi:MAG: acetylglutamate kinase [Clostridiales Family XIII bacterium]|jgi:acetylglutamate kinase|nr:acetylglutamate kinase [Clostridiales Family XIII bacterium]